MSRFYMSNKNVSPTILFETSWEVCNKVGGIYTVLSSKAKVLNERLGDKMIFVGPDVWTSQNPSPFLKNQKHYLRIGGSPPIFLMAYQLEWEDGWFREIRLQSLSISTASTPNWMISTH